MRPLCQTRLQLSTHAPARAIRRVIGQDLWDRYYSFSVVRNPYARLASLYAWLERTRQSHQARQSRWRRIRRLGSRLLGVAPTGPVRTAAQDAEWLRWNCAQAFLETDSFSEFLRHPKALADHALHSQFKALSDPQGRLIVSQVLRLETLNQTFPELAARIGCPTAQLGTHNISPSRIGWRERFRDPADQRWVREKYAADFEAFGYPETLEL